MKSWDEKVPSPDESFAATRSNLASRGRMYACHNAAFKADHTIIGILRFKPYLLMILAIFFVIIDFPARELSTLQCDLDRSLENAKNFPLPLRAG